MTEGSTDALPDLARSEDFSYATRVLLCTACGAPLRCEDGAAETRCAHCGEARRVSARSDTVERVRGGGEREEAERLAELRAASERPELGLVEFFRCTQGGQLTAEGKTILETAWQESYRRLATNPDDDLASQRLFEATTTLVNHHVSRNPERARALLESALEVLPEARQRHVVLCRLAMRAVLTGNRDAGRAWLRRADTRPHDLEADTALRAAQAVLASSEERWGDVLETLGAEPKDVPLLASWRMFCGLLRSNAHERRGESRKAVEQMVYVLRGAPDAGRVVGEYGWAPRAHAAAADHQKAIAEHLFDVGVRTARCAYCGAEAPIDPHATSRRCAHCDAVTQVTTSILTEIVHDGFHHAPGLAEMTPERRSALTSGTSRNKARLPEDVLALCRDGGLLREDRIDDAYALWGRAREQAKARPEGVELLRLYQLTCILFSALLGRDVETRRRRREILEAALHELPAQATTFRCLVALAAIRAGDLEAGAVWLGRCDPKPADIDSHSDYVWGRATLATARRDWDEVLRVLGGGSARVVAESALATPLAGSHMPAVAMLRANALEQKGEVDRATAHLLDEIVLGDASMGAMASIFAERVDPTFCAKSWPAALGTWRRTRAKAIAIVVAVVGAVIAFWVLVSTR